MEVKDILDQSEEELIIILGDAMFEKDFTQQAVAFLETAYKTTPFVKKANTLFDPANDRDLPGRYSLVDLVWITIAHKLLLKGLETEKISALKETLYSEFDLVNVFSNAENQKILGSTLSKQVGISEESSKSVLSIASDYKESAFLVSLLGLYMLSMCLRQISPMLIVNKDGQHTVSYEGLQPKSKELELFISSPHVRISLKEIIGEFLNLAIPVKDAIKQSFLSMDEWKVIEEIRSKRYNSITVKLTTDGKIASYEVIEASNAFELECKMLVKKFGLQYGTLTLEVHAGNLEYARVAKTVKNKKQTSNG